MVTTSSWSVAEADQGVTMSLVMVMPVTPAPAGVRLQGAQAVSRPKNTTFNP
jgi:hypothetical protein